MPESVHQPVLLRTPDQLGVLTREFRVRILNCSSSGCLVETNTRLEVGTIGSLRLAIAGDEFVDDVLVVRCQGIEGAGSVYHVGAKFLWIDPPSHRTLRSAMRQGVGHAIPPDSKPLIESM